MTAAGVPSSRRTRVRKTEFAPAARAAGKMPWGVRIALLIVPVVLFLAHLMFGANQAAAAQWLAAVLALCLLGTLASPVRRGLVDVQPALAPAVLFAVVIGVALLTLTPFTPGGPHPIWAWAGASEGASTINRSATVLEIFKLLGLACVFVAGVLHGWRRDYGSATVQGLVWAGGAYAVIALLSFVTGLQIASTGRLSAGFLSSNTAATVMGVLTVLGLGATLRQLRTEAGLSWARRLPGLALPGACLALTGICLFLTASRAGVGATGIACAALLIWHLAENKGRRLATAGIGLLLAVAGGVLLLGGGGQLWGRIGEIGTDTSLRATLFTAHWEAFLASPLFGYGLGSFDQVNLQLMTSANVDTLWSVRAAHSVYLQWLEEAGLIGALPMFALIGLILVCAVRRSLRLRTGRTQHHALVCANLVVLIHGTADFALQVPSVAAFWAFLLGLQFAFGQDRS